MIVLGAITAIFAFISLVIRSDKHSGKWESNDVKHATNSQIINKLT